MHRPKRWSIAPPDDRAADLAARLKTSPLLAQILLNRGFSDPQACHDFLRPSPKGMAHPHLIPNLELAANRIARAIADQEKIVVYGDYDVDGITAASIVWHAVRLLGGRIDYYIPHRVEEGYGLNAQALADLCEQGARVIISVDCGITAIEQAKIPKERGVDLIITDHHEWHTEGSGLPPLPTAHCPLPTHSVEGSGFGVQGSENPSATLSTQHSALSTQPSSLTPEPQTLNPSLPDCHAIVHPRLPGSTYPNPHLCGAGVALKLAWGIALAVNGAAKVTPAFRDFLVEAMALAALGTIADVVPLIGENRILAHCGLGGLKASKLHGVQALIASAGLAGKPIDGYHVGFLLAPRLNACGRMGHARQAVEMLTNADAPRAGEIAAYLEKQNRERQTIERKILAQALEQITLGGFDRDDCRAIVLGDDSWHPGVIGIVASRIVDRLHRPTIMIATADGHGQGSGRSIPGFNLARGLEACGRHLEAFGGHEMAAGLKIKTSNLPDFRLAFTDYAAGVLSDDMMIPRLALESLAELHLLTEALVGDFNRLGPFGHGNRKPLLCVRGLTIAAPPRRVGKTGDHLQLYVRQGNTSMKCIAFNRGHLIEQLQSGVHVDLAVEPLINEYLGRRTVELDVKDLQFHSYNSTLPLDAARPGE